MEPALEPPPITRPNTRRDRSSAQIWAEGGLAQHPYHLELRGSPNDLSWPRVCANCAQAATEQIRVKKAFRPRPRRYSGGARFLRPYRIAEAPIPFCGQCAAEHRATVQSPSATNKLMSMLLNPLIIPVIGCAWMAKMISNGVRDISLADPGGQLGWSLFALVVVGGVWSAYVLWESTRAARLDPLTNITRSCDFSEDVSEVFEKERRIYAMHNKDFAQALAALNADRAWTEADQSRSRKLSFTFAVLLLVTLGVAAWVISIVSP